MKNLASELNENVIALVDIINKRPEQVVDLKHFVLLSKFDWSYMKAIVCGLKEEWLMDKAIQIMTDTWDEYFSTENERCYQTIGYVPDYAFDGHTFINNDQPLKILKYINLKRDLEIIKTEELKRRNVESSFQTHLQKMKNLKTKKYKRFEKRNNENWMTDKTFIYKASSTDAESTKQIRLEFLSKELILHFLQTDTKKDTVIKLFTGKKIKYKDKIEWRGTVHELVYLFRNLYKKKRIIIPIGNDNRTIGLWNIVASHFSIATELKNGKTKRIPITPKSLQNNSQGITNVEIKKKLDAIIFYFDPDLNEKIQSWLRTTGPDRETTSFEELAVRNFIAGRDKDTNNLRGTAELTD